MKDVEDFSGVTLGPGTVFGCLARLEERGYIEALAPDDRRRPYRLTGLGLEALTEQLKELDRITTTTSKRLSRLAGAE
jgi:DNA-binding PadR family transcriptional regulator